MNARVYAVTGGETLSHRWFALRARAELGIAFGGWFVTNAAPAPADTTAQPRRLSVATIGAQVRTELARGGPAALAMRVPQLVKKMRNRLEARRAVHGRMARARDVEQMLFGDEVNALSASPLTPIWDRPPDGIVLCLDGSPPSREYPVLHACARNVEWALYHRRLDWVRGTVEAQTQGGRFVVVRGMPVLLPTESPESCRLRALAVASSLAIDLALRMTAGEPLTAPIVDTCNGLPEGPVPDAVARDIDRDFADGWLSRELARLRQY